MRPLATTLVLACLAVPAAVAQSALSTFPTAPTVADEVELRVEADAYGDLCGAALAIAPFTPESAEIDIFHTVLNHNVGCPAVVWPVTVRFRLGRLAAGTHTLRLWSGAYPGFPAEVYDELTVTVAEQTGQPLLLHDGRFEVRVTWRDFAGNSGVANTVPGATAESGLLWFFSAGNWELLVKVLDGCAMNDRLWVLGAGATNVGFTLEVVDTVTGERWTHENPLGQPAGTFLDTAAFASACP